jgi:tRNA threonylcarbamoyladenosine biosynthesis protein TsaB
MNILAMDTAGDALSAVLSTPEGIFLAEIQAGVRHSELLMEMVDGLLKTAGLKPAELNAAACMKGPGSFTGLRIGYAAAKGLSLALDIPLLTASTLDCMAFPHSVWPGVVLPVIDAKKSRFFAAFYREGTRLTGFLDAGPETLAGLAAGFLSASGDNGHLAGGEIQVPAGSSPAPVLVTGPAAGLLWPLLSGSEKMAEKTVVKDSGISGGRARELLEIVTKFDILKTGEGENSGPFYLRKSDAEMSLGLI